MKKIIISGLVCLVAGVICAETYYLKDDMNTSKTGNSPLIKELWSTQPNGSGVKPNKITGNFFIVNGKSWRTPNSGMTSRFPGAFIIDTSGAKTGELLSAVWKPTIFIIDGSAEMRLRRPEVSLQPKHLVVDGRATFRAHSDGSRALFIEAGVLKGAGQIIFGKYESTDAEAEWNLRAAETKDFVGAVTVSFGTLTIETALDFDGVTMSIQADAGARLAVDDVTLVLKRLKVNGRAVEPGLYKAEEISKITNGGFRGTGSIRVLYL